MSVQTLKLVQSSKGEKESGLLKEMVEANLRLVISLQKYTNEDYNF